ncbi:MAG: chorismate mutase [Gemmatimonadota bacterium]
MIGIRGAIRVESNDRTEIFRATQRLLREMLRRNGLERSRVVSAFFTMTPDLNADFPAYAAREMGWTDVPMLGAQETAVPGALDRMVRILLHADAPGPARHVYLGDAAAMRPDLAHAGDAERFAGALSVRGAAGSAPAEVAGDTPRAPSPGPTPPALGTLLVVGLGLIGGSLALAVRRSGVCRGVLGTDVDPGAVELARRAGAIDEGATDAPALLTRAAAVVLAVPVLSAVRWMREHGPRLPAGTVLVDVGSTKRALVTEMDALPPGVEAVGAHPLAGSELSGMGAARPDLFFGATWALVRTKRTGRRAEETARILISAVGGRAFWTGAERHDRAVAATSHLPYLLSAALALNVRDREERDEVARLAGPGLRDMTRLAGSRPSVMAEILRTNWENVLAETERFRRRFEELVASLERAMPGDVGPLLERAARAREVLMRPAAGR